MGADPYQRIHGWNDEIAVLEQISEYRNRRLRLWTAKRAKRFDGGHAQRVAHAVTSRSRCKFGKGCKGTRIVDVPERADRGELHLLDRVFDADDQLLDRSGVAD